jgi:uncharacterized UPF0146 family protein
MRPSCQGVVSYVVRNKYSCCAEIGIGGFPDVALELVREGVSVFGTDIKPCQYKDPVVLYDDVMHPDLALYDKVDLIYSLRPPPELVPYMEKLAESVLADLIIKPLASEYPARGQLIGSNNTAFFLWRGR